MLFDVYALKQSRVVLRDEERISKSHESETFEETSFHSILVLQ